MDHSRLAASGKVNAKRNIHNTKNFSTSGRLRAIFAEVYLTFFAVLKGLKIFEKQENIPITDLFNILQCF